jgi:DNA repair exonuclease SbcCD nuclease subunit
MPLSFVHAADFHLGANLRRFGPAGTRLEIAQYRALERTLEAAAARGADFVLICGDLFDSRNPSLFVIEKTQKIVCGFPQVTIFILPGTHDFLSDGSALSPSNSQWAPANAVILDDRQPMPIHPAGSNAYLYFHPNQTNRSTRSPIHDFERIREKGYHIGLAHGSLNLGGPGFDSDFPINPAEIEKTGLDYLALGHWHSPRIENYGRTVAVYPGIPQPVSYSDPERGSVFFVRIAENTPIAPEPIATSTIRLKTVTADIFHPQDLENLLDEHADDRTIIKMHLRYSDKLKEVHAVKEIIAKAKSRFLLVQEDSPKKKSADPPVESIAEINQPLIDAYKAELTHLREVDSPERAVIYERASELGSKLIKGEI